MEVRELDGPAQLRQACALLDAVWRTDAEHTVMPPDLLRALTLAGSYAAGAYADGELLGVSVGVFGPPRRRALHSHVTGVAASARGRGVGRALKLHQREWALARGVDRVTWTFDPLVRRNAHVNLVRLGATVAAYLPDLYGPLQDAFNAGTESDRLLVEWELASDHVLRALAGALASSPRPDVTGLPVALAVGTADEPRIRPVTGTAALVEVPADIEALRSRDPVLAARWRTAVREVLGGLLGAGATVSGFADGRYVVSQPCG